MDESDAVDQVAPAALKGRRQTMRPAPLRVACLALILAVSGATVEAQQTEECLDLINQVLSLVYSDVDGAEQIYQQALDSCEIDPQRQLKLRWRMATELKNEADERRNRCEQYMYGHRAVNAWKDYIEWCRQQHAGDYFDSAALRVQQATEHLFDALKTRGEPGSCPGDDGLMEIFSVLGSASVEELNADTVDNWMNWLWRCPDWLKEHSRGYAWVTENVCNDLNEWPCSRFWHEYLSFLVKLTENPPNGYQSGTIDAFRARAGRITKALRCDHASQ